MSRERATITGSGAIVFDNIVTVDGYYKDAYFHVVTHIHSDHTKGVKRSIRRRIPVAATPITLDILEALGIPINSTKTIRLNYGERLELDNGATLQLQKTNHIPGSSMVVYQDRETTIAYTSDFKLPGTHIVEEPDLLVLDATYGREEWRRPWQEEVENILVDIVLEGLSRGPVILYAYNGKIQEVMLLLRRHGVVAPFLAPLKPYIVAKIVKKHGLDLGDVYYEYDARAREIAREGWYVLFLEMREWKRRREYGRRLDGKPTTHVLLTGWEFSESFRRISTNEWIVSFSDHADFDQLVEYLEMSKPRKIIVDAYRGGETAYSFAKYVERNLSIPAKPLPLLAVEAPNW